MPTRSGTLLSRSLLGVLAAVAVLFASMPFWQAQLYGTGGFAGIPSYWTQAANWLDSHQGHQTALLVPGSTFAQYTWGSPEDEPLSMLASTSVTVRSIIPLGSGGNTEMLAAVESALATGTAQPGLAEYLSRSGNRLCGRAERPEPRRDKGAVPCEGPPGSQSEPRSRRGRILRPVPAGVTGCAG